MKRKTSLWGSISLLIGVVIAILALVRGAWTLPLLIIVFAVWGFWVLWTLVLLPRRSRKRQKEQTVDFNRQMAQTLLRHVNYRVSACLKAAYPDARWEWMMRDPALFVAQGGTGRIRVYGIAGYEFADVTVDQAGRLACSLVKLAPVEETGQKPEASDRQPLDPQQWYETQGKEVMDRLVIDLASRGHSSLAVKEDGTVYVTAESDGKEVKQGVLAGFPAKSSWPRLAELLEENSLTAALHDDHIIVEW